MTGGPAEVRDPTLFRLYCLRAWYAAEPEQASDARLDRLQNTLHQWLGSRITLPKRAQLAWTERKLADEPGPPRDSWSSHVVVISRHENLLVYLGVSQIGIATLDASWLEAAQARWVDRFPALELSGGEPATRSPLLGDAWISTGEWLQQPPSWNAFARAAYDDRFVEFPWGGVLGLESHVSTRFDLHTSSTAPAKEARDRFLFGGLGVLLNEYLKATQFLRSDYETALRPRLDARERKVAQASHETVLAESSLRRLKGTVLALSRLLVELDSDIADLERDLLSVDSAVATVTSRLSSELGAAPTGSGFLIEAMSRVANQMRSDLSYFRTTAAQGKTALDGCRTVVEIQQARATDRLTVVGILVGAALGIGSLLPEADVRQRFTWALGLALVGILAVYLERIWAASRARRTAEPPERA